MTTLDAATLLPFLSPDAPSDPVLVRRNDLDAAVRALALFTTPALKPILERLRAAFKGPSFDTCSVCKSTLDVRCLACEQRVYAEQCEEHAREQAEKATYDASRRQNPDVAYLEDTFETEIVFHPDGDEDSGPNGMVLAGCSILNTPISGRPCTTSEEAVISLQDAICEVLRGTLAELESPHGEATSTYVQQRTRVLALPGVVEMERVFGCPVKVEPAYVNGAPGYRARVTVHGKRYTGEAATEDDAARALASVVAELLADVSTELAWLAEDRESRTPSQRRAAMAAALQDAGVADLGAR
jgi:hypothetical protein